MAGAKGLAQLVAPIVMEPQDCGID